MGIHMVTPYYPNKTMQEKTIIDTKTIVIKISIIRFSPELDLA